jgi:hypothetical protein
LGDPGFSTSTIIAPTSINATSNVGSTNAIWSPGPDQAANVSSVTSANTFGTLIASGVIQATSIPSSATIGTQTQPYIVGTAPQTTFVFSIESEAVVGIPTFQTTGPPPTQVLSPGGITSSASVGTVVVVLVVDQQFVAAIYRAGSFRPSEVLVYRNGSWRPIELSIINTS